MCTLEQEVHLFSVSLTVKACFQVRLVNLP